MTDQSSFGELSVERRLLVVENKIEVWHNTLYDAQLDAEVATLTKDDNLLQMAQQRIKQSLQALQLLTEKQKELEQTVAGERESQD